MTSVGKMFDETGTPAVWPPGVEVPAWKAAFETSAAWMMVCDSRLIVRDVNTVCVAAEGLSRAEMVGRHVADLMGEAVFLQRLPQIEIALDGRSSSVVEWGLRRATRGQLLRIRHEPVLDAAGAVVGVLLVMEDQTDLHQLERRVSMQDEVINQTLDALAVVDTEYRYLWANPSYAMLWNRTPQEVMGRTVPEVVGAEGFRERVLPWLSGCFEGRVAQYEFTKEKQNGEEIHIAVRLEPFRGEDGEVTGVIVNARDVTESALLNRRLRRQALEDSLTGLANRHALESELTRRIEGCAEAASSPGCCRMAMFLVDLDDFKVVNDLAGHVAGDALLRQVASLLRAVDRKAHVARLGGDEFALLLEVARDKSATEIGERIVATIEDAGFTWQGHHFSVGASIGVAMLDSGAFAASVPTAQDIINWADRACLVAKEKGGSRVSVFHAEDGEIQARFEEIGNLQVVQNALLNGRFALHAMPIAPIGTDSRLWHEVLLRVLGEDDRPLPPQVFITAAERHGLMNRVDRWVVETVLERLPSLPAETRLTVNLSGQSVGDPIFCDFLIGALDRAAPDPGRLAFEITETAAVRSMETALSLIAGLKQRGHGVILDDFGSGLSSFGYLRNFDVDMLKIDGKLIGNIREDEVQQTIVAGIVAVAEAMRIRVVAEFVEDEETLSVLRDLGVSLVQGYHIGMPVPWDEAFPA